MLVGTKRTHFSGTQLASLSSHWDRCDFVSLVFDGLFVIVLLGKVRC